MDTHKTVSKDILGSYMGPVAVDVLEKVIFSNVFGKDIRRVFIYKKAERIAQVIHLLGPAFKGREELGKHFDRIALSIIEVASRPEQRARQTIAEHLLTLGSLVRVAGASGLLSQMNSTVLIQEVESLLTEIASYQEPHVTLPETESLAQVYKEHSGDSATRTRSKSEVHHTEERRPVAQNKGRAEYRGGELTKRQSDILTIVKDKKVVHIKDVSVALREYGEKTLQRELAHLVHAGLLVKKGERRWTTYSLQGT